MHNQAVNNAPMAQPNRVAITAAAFRAKYNSKREVFNFISVDCGVYLPSYGKWPKTPFLTFKYPTYRTSHYLLPQGYRQRQEEK